MSGRRVVVTGVGGVTPLGPTMNADGDNIFWDNIKAGKSAIKPIRQLRGLSGVFDRIQGAEIANWQISDYFQRNNNGEGRSLKRLEGLDKAIQFAAAATKLALRDADLSDSPEKPEFGFYVGNGMQCISNIENTALDITGKYAMEVAKHILLVARRMKDLSSTGLHDSAQTEGLSSFVGLLEENIAKFGEQGIHDFEDVALSQIFKEVPSNIFNFPNYAISGHVTRTFELHGPALAVNSACSSGSDAIGQAFRAIKDGDAEVIVSGGTEAPIAFTIVSMFNQIKVMSRNGVKPGDKNRDGFALGEGSGFLILEELEHALKRGAKIYSELAAYSQTSDAYSMISLVKSGEFVIRAVRNAIGRAGLSIEDVDYINPHATSTQQCDEVESRILRTVFGDHLKNVAVHPTKCFTGHFQAGAGAVEAILINLIFQKDFIPGIPVQSDPDPKCVSFVSPEGISKRINVALSDSMGFGGHNSVLIFKRFDGR